MTDPQAIQNKIQFKTRNPKQLLAARHWIDKVTEEILYGGAKGGGKSYLGASLILGDAIMYPGTHYFIARQALVDLRNFTVPTIHEVFRNWGLNIEEYAKYNGQDHVFNFYNKSKVHLIDCKEVPSDPLYERFGSMQMTRGWIEEAGEVVEAAKSNLWLSIGRWRNDEYGLKKKMLMTANPKKGWMKREFVDPAKTNELPETRIYIQAFATDNVYLPKDYINTLKSQKDKVARQRLWEGNWDYDEDMDALTDYDSLSDAFTNTITKDNEKYLVVDVARRGRDLTVFSFWDGLELYRVEMFQKQGTDKTEQQARDFAAADRIPFSNVIIDEDGVGGGVVDHLLGVKGFTANSTPMPTRSEVRERGSKIENYLIPKRTFANLKAQCAWKLAELVNEHKIAFKVPEYRDIIIEELTELLRQKNPDMDGKLQLKPKDEVKQALGRSPDVGDTLIMRAWFELKKDATAVDPQQRTQVVQTQNRGFAEKRERSEMNSTK